jgi:BON domain
MGHFSSMLNGLGLGLSAMYFFDPARGRYRQSLVRGQLTRILNDAEHFVGVGWRDLRNRSSGWIAEMSNSGSGDTDDQTLENRVRSKLGRIVSHPRAIEVSAQNGNLCLSGSILSSEADAAIQCAQQVPGVHAVENRFQRHESAEGISDLQGRRATGTMNMTPATQLLLASSAIAVVGLTCARRAPLTFLLGSAAMLAFAGEQHAMQRQQSLASRGTSGRHDLGQQREGQQQESRTNALPTFENQRSAAQPTETMASP